MQKYVYLFSEGNAQMRNTLGGKGAQPCRDDQSRYARPAGLHHFHRGLHFITTRTAVRSPMRSWGRSMTRLTKIEEINGKKFGDAGESAPRFRPLRRARVHARHDGHDS